MDVTIFNQTKDLKSHQIVAYISVKWE